MGTFSVWHWLIVLVVVLILFGGGGKIPKLMRDMGPQADARHGQGHQRLQEGP
jgi:sec-independent protein translocase protein TatA